MLNGRVGGVLSEVVQAGVSHAINFSLLELLATYAVLDVKGASKPQGRRPKHLAFGHSRLVDCQISRDAAAARGLCTAMGNTSACMLQRGGVWSNRSSSRSCTGACRRRRGPTAKATKSRKSALCR